MKIRANFKKLGVLEPGESCAQINAERLDYYHRLEREHVHLTLLEEGLRGVADVRIQSYFPKICR